MKKIKKYERLIAKMEFLSMCGSAFYQGESKIRNKVVDMRESFFKNLSKKRRKKLFKSVKTAIKERLKLDEC